MAGKVPTSQELLWLPPGRGSKGCSVILGGEKQQFCVEVKSLAFKPVSNFCSCGNNCSPQTVQKQQFLVWSIAPQCLGERWRPRETRTFLYILSYSVPNFIMVQIRQSYNCGNDISEIPYWSPMNAGIQSVHCRLHSHLLQVNNCFLFCTAIL